jgi:hypothetical protein
MDRELSKAELNRVVKTQGVRLVDVFLLGPLMIYSASQLPQRNKAARAALLFFGVTTVLYNLHNFARVRLTGHSR